MSVDAGAWLPRFACPECGTVFDAGDSACLACGGCGREYRRQDGVWRFLTPARAAQLDAFVRQYRIVREREGRRQTSPEYYRQLPAVPARDPYAGDWRIRRETYAHLLRRVLAPGQPSSRVLDLGAGSGWLAHRLSSLGHRVVAVDALDDEADGLGAVRHYPTAIVAVHADFDALPFAPAQFDLVVFNGSLHYAPDAGATLARARTMLDAGGTLVVMDSPMFRADRDGAAMVARGPLESPGRGYLTFDGLQASASALHMEPEFVPSRGSLAWRTRRRLARLRLGRAPAAFGLWVAR